MIGYTAVRKSLRRMKKAGDSMLVFAAMTYDTGRAEEASGVDEMLLVQIAEGESEAFRRLYELTWPAVYAYALTFLRSREDAQDIAQDTFVKIRCAAHLYTPQGKPMAWILTIARNLCLMKLRQDRRAADISPALADGAITFDTVSETEDKIVLEAAFKVLSGDEARIILLHAVSGMKHREISQSLSMPLSTVPSKYRRGLAKLRRELEGR